MVCIIGIDVGGTNTDAVVLRHKEVLAWEKVTTTKDITTGVVCAIHGVLSKIKPQDIRVQQINVGTTHFVNSIVQRSHELAKVGVIRIATKPNTEAVPAFFDFPKDLKHLIDGGYSIVSGGCDFDGSEMASLDETEIVNEVANFLKNGVKNIVLISVFSPVNPKPEEEVREIICQRFGPSISCTLSYEIGQLSFIERENASILNESLKPLCQKALKNLKSALENLNLKCPLFISQNDGTIINLEYAIEHPVITFASGPTNSMRGAAFISGAKDAIVVDIGGTTTDVGVLIKGFPRLSGAHVQVGGIRTNFRMPDTYSIGLGGGSRVRVENENVFTIGPDSVGYRLTNDAISFGGQTLTATDLAACADLIKTPNKPPTLDNVVVDKILSKIIQIVEETIDTMKTSSEEIPVILVGGGSILVKPNIKLSGSSKTIRPKNAEVANAIGSALCQVSGRIDIISTIDPIVKNSAEKLLEKLKISAIEEAVKNGAVRETIELVDIEFIPVSYLPGNAVRIKIVAVGELGAQGHLAAPIDWDKLPTKFEHQEAKAFEDDNGDLHNAINNIEETSNKSKKITRSTATWSLTDDDVEKISIGASILGCGGGGNPYLGKLRLLDQLRHGKTINVISLDSLLHQDSKQYLPFVIPVGYMGAPAVQTEKIHSKIEVLTALFALQSYLSGEFNSYEFQTNETGVEYLRLDKLSKEKTMYKPFFAVLPLEIGGINSTEPLAIAAEIEGRCLDADLMGRAFPELQMATPYIYGQPCTPFAMASWRGEIVIVRKASDPKHLEDFARKICVEFGCSAGTAESPIPIEKLRDYCIVGSMTRCLNLGQAVINARKLKKDPIREIFLVEPGKIICSGRITLVDRQTIGGFNRGYFIIHDLKDNSEKKVDFQNENLVVWEGNKPLATVPDLIVAFETDTGEPIIVDDMRYGLRATLVVLPPSELLTTPKALQVVGPSAFGYKGFDYVPFI